MTAQGAMGSVVRLADRFRGSFQGLAAAVDARRHAKVVQTLPLGPGSRLIVVEFAGKRLLIGQARGVLVRLDGCEAEL